MRIKIVILTISALLIATPAYAAEHNQSIFQRAVQGVFCSVAGLWNVNVCTGKERVAPRASLASDLMTAALYGVVSEENTEAANVEKNNDGASIDEGQTASNQTIVNRYITQPVIQRTLNTREVIRESGVTQEQFNIALNELRKELYNTQANSDDRQSTAVWRAISLSQKIDNISGTTISGSTITNSAISGNSGSFTTLTASGATSLAGLTTSGNATIGGDLTITGTTSLGAITTSLTQGSIAFAGASGLLSEDTGNLFWDDTNNRLGIGTTTPSYPLDVVGITQASGGFRTNSETVTDFSGAGITITGGALTATLGTSIANSELDDDTIDFDKIADTLIVDATTTFDLDTNAADLNFDGNTLLIDSSTNRVGIGTASPSYKLDVYYNTSATTGGTNYAQQSFLMAQPNGVASANYIGIYGLSNYNSPYNNTGGGGVIGLRGHGYTTNARSGVVAGLDGIAESNSSATTSLATSLYGARFTAKNTGTGRITHGIGFKVNSPTNNGTVDIMYGGYIAAISGGTENSALHIEGAGVDNAITFSGNNGSSPNAKIYSPSENVLYVDATSKLVLQPITGNVGIGTTTPSAQLHTTGSVRFATFGAGTLQTDASGNLSVSSDVRLKDVAGDFIRSIDDLLGIVPIIYKWNEDSGFDTSTLYAGFSAQNVKENIPEAVGEDRQGFLTFSDRPILAALVNGLKEMWGVVILNREKNAVQDEKDAEFEARIAALEAQLANSAVTATTPNDTTPQTPAAPIIELLGNNPAEVAVGAKYSDLGAVARDSDGSDLSVTITVDGAATTSVELDTGTDTTYTIEYRAQDSSGQVVTGTRTVIVGGGATESMGDAEVDGTKEDTVDASALPTDNKDIEESEETSNGETEQSDDPV